MKETRAPLVALGLVVAATLFASVLAKGGDLATRPRQGRVDLPAHPLYASLPSENRRVLTLGEGDELPNYVYEDDEDEGAAAGEDVVGSFGDSVTGYNLPDSFSSAPSYADPSLLSAVMQQAEQANFRYPLATTRRPPADQAASGSVSSPSQATDNDLNAYSLFPPQFHELLAIPLHVYKNGSTYNPHGRPHHVPLRPFISKGYANTKIQGGSKVRVPEKQDTPHVAYKPKPVYEDAPKRPTTKYQTTTPAPTTSTTTTTTTTTRPPPTTTTDQRPRRPTYASPPPRPSYRPTESTTTETYDETTVPYYSRPSSLPFRPPTDSSPASPKPTRRDPPAKVSFNYKRRPTIPSDLPPLRYTRRPSTYTTPTTTERPTTPPRPTTTRRPTTTPRPATTFLRTTSAPPPTTTRRQPDFSYETFRVTSKPAAAPAPARDALPPSSRPTSDGRPRPTPVQQDRPTAAVQPKPTRVERPQEERVVEFRPSKLDPFLPPSPPPTTYRPPAANKITPQGAPQQLPPVVNTFVQPTTAPESSSSLAPASLDRLPPPPQPPSRPFIPPPPPRPPTRPLSSLPPLPSGRPVPPPSPASPSNRPALPPPPSGLPALPPPPSGRPALPPPPSGRPALPPPPSGRPALPPPPSGRPVLPPRPPTPAARPALPPPSVGSPDLLPPPPPTGSGNKPVPPQFSSRPQPQRPLEKRPPPPPPLPSPFSRPAEGRPVLPPASFGPPPRQPAPLVPRPSPAQLPAPVPGTKKPTRPWKDGAHATHFQIIEVPEASPPRPQDVADQPDPGFNLPAEADNLPRRPQAPPAKPDLDGVNVLPRFRPNAPPQEETFGFQDPPRRVFNTRPRPLRPDRRPVLSKRPSFLENFNFFGRTPVDRRRGETGPLVETNNANVKVGTKQPEGDALRYKLHHGPVPNNAQKVVVIGPFNQPPPGAPIIPLPDKEVPPPVAPKNPGLLPPPPPPAPTRRVSASQTNSGAVKSPETHIPPPPPPPPAGRPQAPKRAPAPLPPQPLIQKPPMSSQDLPEKPAPLVVYSENEKEDKKTHSDVETAASKSGAQGPSPNASRTAFGPSAPEEVSEEHKEAIIAGRIRFPAFSGVERSDSGSVGLPPGAIPMPVPIFDGSKLVVPAHHHASRRVLPPPTPKPSPSSSFWSFLGFGSSKPAPPPVAADRRVVVSPPAPHSPARVPSQPANYIRPPPPFRAQPQQGVTSKPRPVNNPRPQPFYTRTDRPAPATVPRPAPPAQPASATRPNPPAFVAPLTRPEATPRPFSQSPPSTEPRPVYRHTSTAPPPTVPTTTTPTTTSTSTTTTTHRPTTTRSPPSPSPPTTSLPVTPMRITEYNPYFANAPQYDENHRGGFKPPTLQSSSYDGWRVVGVPSTPLEGQGDSLSPVVSFVKENTPEIIIRAPTQESSDDDIVTGVISDRMGEVADGDQLVQFSSQLNVETPGIVRSYWVEPPSLA